jgi:hypothetical protein
MLESSCAYQSNYRIKLECVLDVMAASVIPKPKGKKYKMHVSS